MNNGAELIPHVTMHEMKSSSIYGMLTLCYKSVVEWPFSVKGEESGLKTKELVVK